MSYEDDLAGGIGGLRKIEGGLDGNMGEWAEGYAIERTAERRSARQPVYERSSGKSGSKVPILVFALIVIVLLVLFL